MRLVETYCFYVCVDETLQNQKRKSLDDIRLSDFSPDEVYKVIHVWYNIVRFSNDTKFDTNDKNPSFWTNHSHSN